HFGFDTLRDLPDMEALEDAGLLSKDMLLAGDIPLGLMAGDTDDGEPEEVEADEES
ncbi:MAG TPA: segregation and condensation protein B, partial [Xanthobacteraceae bacterium]|nr:segregation and condensation protein B [Xanthobacteraceae bacterium]